MEVLKKLKQFFKKIFTMNYCIHCGFTKDEVFPVNLYSEIPGYRCQKCIDNLKNKKKK